MENLVWTYPSSIRPEHAMNTPVYRARGYRAVTAPKVAGKRDFFRAKGGGAGSIGGPAVTLASPVTVWKRTCTTGRKTR
jgi:hypothetical protein